MGKNKAQQVAGGVFVAVESQAGDAVTSWDADFGDFTD